MIDADGAASSAGSSAATSAPAPAPAKTEAPVQASAPPKIEAPAKPAPSPAPSAPRAGRSIRRSGASATPQRRRKFAVLHSSAASRARITLISRRFPAPALVAASANTIFAPPSKAVALHEAHLVFQEPPPRRRAQPLLRHLLQVALLHRPFSRRPSRARKCTSATTKSSLCR